MEEVTFNPETASASILLEKIKEATTDVDMVQTKSDHQRYFTLCGDLSGEDPPSEER